MSITDLIKSPPKGWVVEHHSREATHFRHSTGAVLKLGEIPAPDELRHLAACHQSIAELLNAIAEVS